MRFDCFLIDKANQLKSFLLDLAMQGEVEMCYFLGFSYFLIYDKIQAQVE